MGSLSQMQAEQESGYSLPSQAAGKVFLGKLTATSSSQLLWVPSRTPQHRAQDLTGLFLCNSLSVQLPPSQFRISEVNN
jgi:hypothetical protein